MITIKKGNHTLQVAKNTYETLKDVSTEFYENTKNKAENWYKNYKESRN